MKLTDAIIIMKNYLWMHKMEMSLREKEALKRILDAVVLYRAEERERRNHERENETGV